MKFPQAALLFAVQAVWSGLMEVGNSSRSDTFMNKRSTFRVSQAAFAGAFQPAPVKHYHFDECKNIPGATTPGPTKWLQTGSPAMSQMVCYIFCMKHKTIYFATRAGKDCVCFDNFEEEKGNSTCDVPCAGNSTENCGGMTSWRVHIISAWVPHWKEIPCGDCPAVEHALFSRPLGNDSIPHSCDVGCMPGYGVSVNNLLCDTTRGLWVGIARCEELICATPPRIPNSSSVCTEASAAKDEGACNVTCLPGFELRENTLKCSAPTIGTEGVLVGDAICKARSCEMSTVYPNTIAMQVNPELGEKVMSTCAPGFSLDGTKDGPNTFTSTCLQDGKMSPTNKTCQPKKCGETLPTIPNAKAQSGTDGLLQLTELLFYPNITTFECLDGYQLAQSSNGEKIFSISCQVTGEWAEFPTCAKVSCGVPPIVSNAVLVDNSTSSKTLLFEEKVSYKCQDGYALDKDQPEKNGFQLTCNADTLFSAQPMPPTCVKLSCGDPQGVVKGAKVVGKFTPEAFFGDKLEYSCPPGFTPTGHASDPASVSGECMANGKIQLSDPAKSECLQVSCDKAALSITNALWDPETAQAMKAGVKAFTKLHYTCAEHYSLDGSQSLGAKKSYITCEATGKFTEPAVKCLNIDDCVGHTCGPFGSCVDGLGNYSCDCQVNKTQKTDKVTGELVCGDPWECGPRECGAGTCVDLIDEYTCDCPPGHPLLSYGDNHKACSDEPVACGMAPAIPNTKPVSKKMLYGDSTTYVCKAGYNTSDGSATADGQPGFVVACGADPADVTRGKLLGTKTCVPMKCGFPPLAESPMITYDTSKEIAFPDVATYTCPAGQTVSDPKGLPVAQGGSKTFTRSCLDTTKFSSPSGECDWVTCTLSEAPRMVAEPNPCSIPYGKSHFTCKKGYTLDPLNPTQGDVIELTCQEDGSIIGLRHCEPITCKAPLGSEDGGAVLMKASQLQTAASFYEVSEGEDIEYTRKELGYYFIGDQGQEIFEFKAHCGPTGIIEGIKPSQKISCGKLPSVAHGAPKSATKSAMSFKDVVTVECNPDYEMHPTIWAANNKPANEKEFNLVCQGDKQISGLHGVPAGSACVLAACNYPEQKCSEGGGICEPGAGIEGRPYVCKCPKDYEYKIDEGDSVCAPIPKLKECPIGACGRHGQCLLANYTYSCDCDNGYEEKNVTGIKVCKAKPCPALEVISNTTMKGPVNMSYTDKTTVSCKPGFSLDGGPSSTDFTVECRADGTLSPQFVCRLVECGLAPAVHFSKSKSVLNEVGRNGLLLQRQKPGRSTQPRRSQMPKAPGSKTQPQASGKVPGTKTQPDASRNRVYVAGETALYTCMDGYTLDGKPSGKSQLEIQCQLDGSFEPVTHCEPVTCGNPPGITNGQQAQPSQVVFPSVVSYVCNPGYSFDAAKRDDIYKRIKCQSNGALTSMDGSQVFPKDVPLKCHKLSCGEPPEFSGSHRPQGVKYLDEMVTYTCNAGTSVNGVVGGDTAADSKCQVGGTYTLKAFPCQPIKVTVAGYIKDATTGMPIPDAEVFLQNTSAASGFDGRFEFQGMLLGNFALKVVKLGYTQLSKDLKIEDSIPEGTSADMSLSPNLHAGQLRFVLSWNAEPLDLDPHLHWGPAGGGCHVYFNQPGITCGAWDGVTASLDLDDQDGYGPETITVKNLQKCKAANGASQPYLGPDTCKFFYRVINFSGGGYLSEWKKFSGAKVKVYATKGLLAEFDIAKDGFIDQSRAMENWFAFGMQIHQNGTTSIYPCQSNECSGGFNLDWGGFEWEYE